MTWFTENPWPLTVFSAAVALVLLVFYFNSRRAVFLFAIGGVGVFAGLVWLVDALVISDREQVAINLQEMAAAAEKGDADKFVQFISAEFCQQEGIKQEHLLQRGRAFFPPDPNRRIKVSEVIVEDLKPGEYSAECIVNAWGKYNGYPDVDGYPVRVLTVFKKESDGKFRVLRFKVTTLTGGIEIPVMQHLR